MTVSIETKTVGGVTAYIITGCTLAECKAEARRISESVDADRFISAKLMIRAGAPVCEVWLRADKAEATT